MICKILKYDNLYIKYDSFFSHKKTGYYPYIINKEYNVLIDFGNNNFIEGYIASSGISITQYICVSKINISDAYLLKFLLYDVIQYNSIGEIRVCFYCDGGIKKIVNLEDGYLDNYERNYNSLFQEFIISI